MYPIGIKEEAIKLRKKGYSLLEISLTLKIAKSTAAVWLNEVILNSRAQLRLRQRGIIGQYKTQLIKKKKMEELLQSFKENARKDIQGITKSREIYKLICSILFWCEGNKDKLSFLRFTNSDPKMIRCFLNLLREGFDLNERKLRALIHLHDYHKEKAQIDYWSRVTGIPKEQFNHSYHKPHTGKRIKKDYQGCIAISYYDAKLARELWSYYQVFSELAI